MDTEYDLVNLEFQDMFSLHYFVLLIQALNKETRRIFRCFILRLLLIINLKKFLEKKKRVREEQSVI